jgi:hypothetical protein
MDNRRKQPMRYVYTALAALALAGATDAQTWSTYPLPPANAGYGEPDYASYNYDRAYRRFLNSPYQYRTFSSLSSGRGAEYLTPFSREGYYRQPGYEHQRITPYGFESYGYVPGRSEYRATPFGFERYDVPGQPYGYVVPRGTTYPR